MNRREFSGMLSAGLLASLAPRSASAVAQAVEGDAFTHETVIALAADLAAKPYEPPPQVAAPLRELSYQQYRDIRFKPEAALWRNEKLGFTVDFLTAGFMFDRAVNIFVIEDGAARQIGHDPGMFDFGELVSHIDAAAAEHFSGFKLRAPINTADHLDEFTVFQGASYFRAVGEGQNYGLSARGLAIATAEAKGEEFPLFRAFWIERPQRHAKTITVHALLDSESVTGAYLFRITPGSATRMEIDATLFARENIEAITNCGLAPLSSMFLFNQRSKNRFDDFRPAVHDSDGLLMRRSNGEQLWRPLNNPRTLQLSAFEDTNPAGFGLIQRSRKISDFEDLEARYDKRPSVWIEPKGDWGPGEVVLVEIPTERETNDNIVAFWKPKAPLEAGKSLKFGYWLTWGTPGGDAGLARVKATRTGLSTDGDGRLFVIDFTPATSGAQALRRDVHPQVWASRGEIRNIVGQFRDVKNCYRLSFSLHGDEGEPIELGAVLTNGETRISEQWLYRWTL